MALGYVASWACDVGFATLIMAISLSVRGVAGTVMGVFLFLVLDTFLGWGLGIVAWAAGIDAVRASAGPSAWLLALVSDRLETLRTSRATLRWDREMYAEPNREGWQRTQGYLREMNRRTRAQGGRFLVASWPLLVRLDDYPKIAFRVDNAIDRSVIVLTEFVHIRL